MLTPWLLQSPSFLPGLTQSKILFLFLIERIGGYWFKKSHRFQVCSSITQPLCIVLCVHHPKSRLLPSHLPPLALFHLAHPFTSGDPRTVVCVCELFLDPLLSLAISSERSPRLLSGHPVTSSLSLPPSRGGLPPFASSVEEGLPLSKPV